MGVEIVVPVVLFLCIVAVVKIIADTRLRRRLSETHASEELVKTMFLADEQNRRWGALKWGMVLTLLGLAFGLIDLLGLQPDSPATFGLLLGAAGIGMLGYHGVTKRDGQ